MFSGRIGQDLIEKISGHSNLLKLITIFIVSLIARGRVMNKKIGIAMKAGAVAVAAHREDRAMTRHLTVMIVAFLLLMGGAAAQDAREAARKAAIEAAAE